MMRLLEEQEKAISLGDISRVEEMLVTQAHVLQAISSHVQWLIPIGKSTHSS